MSPSDFMAAVEMLIGDQTGDGAPEFVLLHRKGGTAINVFANVTDAEAEALIERACRRIKNRKAMAEHAKRLAKLRARRPLTE